MSNGRVALWWVAFSHLEAGAVEQHRVELDGGVLLGSLLAALKEEAVGHLPANANQVGDEHDGGSNT